MKKRAKPAKKTSRSGSPKKAARAIRPKRRLQKNRKPLKLKKLKPKQKTTPFLSKTTFVVSQPASSAQNGLPGDYGDNKIVLLVRDPWWLFAYWEVTPGHEAGVSEQIRRAGLTKQKTVLRVYDTTEVSPEKTRSFFDIELNFFVDHWYIDVGSPDRSWVVDLGIRTVEGHFFTLVRSNQVHTPRFGPSNVLDEEWMLPEEISRKIFGLSGVSKRGSGSLDFKKLWGSWGRSSSDLTRKAPLP